MFSFWRLLTVGCKNLIFFLGRFLRQWGKLLLKFMLVHIDFFLKCPSRWEIFSSIAILNNNGGFFSSSYQINARYVGSALEKNQLKFYLPDILRSRRF